jgi:hypothetical protein
MKRSSSILLATLLVALIGRPGLAQSLSVGPKAGIGFANGGGDVEDTNSNFGFNIGGVFGIQLNDYFRLEMNGQYVQKGFWQDVIAEIDGGTRHADDTDPRQSDRAKAIRRTGARHRGELCSLRRSNAV